MQTVDNPHYPYILKVELESLRNLYHNKHWLILNFVRTGLSELFHLLVVQIKYYLTQRPHWCQIVLTQSQADIVGERSYDLTLKRFSSIGDVDANVRMEISLILRSLTTRDKWILPDRTSYKLVISKLFVKAVSADSLFNLFYMSPNGAWEFGSLDPSRLRPLHERLMEGTSHWSVFQPDRDLGEGRTKQLNRIKKKSIQFNARNLYFDLYTFRVSWCFRHEGLYFCIHSLKTT